MISISNKECGCRIVTVEKRLTAVIKAKVPLNDMRDAQRSLRRRIDAAIQLAEVGTLGLSLTRWRPPVAGVMEMEPGILVSRPFTPVDDLVPSCLPAGRAASFQLMGGYEGIPGAWRSLFNWCTENQLTLAGINWEIYEHGGKDPSKPQTSLYALLGAEA